MGETRFDTVTRLFAERNLARRTLLAGSRATLAAGANAATGLAARAQEATPEGGDETVGGQAAEFLFVQSFQSGTLEPKANEEGVFTLSLDHGLGQTLYFSDRAQGAPERIVGTQPTDRFLAGLGFPPDNPPNAALVVDEGDGAVNIVVVELLNPVLGASGPSLTYDVIALADYERTTDLGFREAPADLSAVPAAFGAAHLFIDDCPDWDIQCSVDGELAGNLGSFGHCYSWEQGNCYPCNPWFGTFNAAEAYWSDQCNQVFAGCKGNCTAEGVCSAGFYCPDN